MWKLEGILCKMKPLWQRWHLWHHSLTLSNALYDNNWEKLALVLSSKANILETNTNITGSMPPTRWLPPSRKKLNRTRGTQLSTWTQRGGIWTDALVCLHYWVIIWVAGWSNYITYITQFMVCVIGRIHMVVFCFRAFTAFHYHHCARLLIGTECI